MTDDTLEEAGTLTAIETGLETFNNKVLKQIILLNAAKTSLPPSINDKVLLTVLGDNRASIKQFGHDELVNTSDHVIVLCRGQVTAALLSETACTSDESHDVADEKSGRRHNGQQAKSLLNTVPLMKRAFMNLISVSVDSQPSTIIDIEEIAKIPDLTIPDGHRLVLYAEIPSTILIINRTTFHDWCKCYLDLNHKYENDTKSQQRSIALTAPVNDLIIRNGLTTARKVRVLDRNKCNRCGDCEKACASLYGQKRLSIHGVALGRLSLIDACRVCVEPRCLAACPETEAIVYSDTLRELIINRDACTGKQYCQAACPHQAIEMWFPEPTTGQKSAAETKKGQRTDPKADKCDHCVNYVNSPRPDGVSHQACIAACPRGALFEVDPPQLLGALAVPQSAPDVAIREDPVRPLRELERTAFSANIPTPHQAALRSRVNYLWWGTALVLLCGLIEILLRRYHHELSLWALYLRGRRIPIPGRSDGYQPGHGLGLFFGGMSVLLLGTAFFYSLVSRVMKPERTSGRRLRAAYAFLRTCSFHQFSGTVAMGFLVLHVGGRFSADHARAISGRVAFIAMFVLVLCGAVLRWLPTYLHGVIARAQEAELRLRRRLKDLVPEQRVEAAILGYVAKRDPIAQPLLAQEQGCRDLPTALRALWLLQKGYLRLHSRELERLLDHEHRPAQRILDLTDEIVRSRWAQTLVPMLAPLSKSVRYFHICASLVALGFVLLHVVAEWRLH